MGPAYVVIASFYALGAFLTSQAIPRTRNGHRPVAATVTGRVSAWTRSARRHRPHLEHAEPARRSSGFVLLFNLFAFPLTNGLLPYVAREIYRVDQTGLGYLIASIAARRHARRVAS